MTKKNRKAIELWPGHFTASHAIVALSLMLNIALFALLIAMAQTNIFDNQIVNRGAEIICSKQFQNEADTDTRALLEYSCAEGAAQPYFVKGYNEYRQSVGLSPVKE